MDTTNPPANTPWFEGLDPTTAGFAGDNAAAEFRGYLANRGWDKSDVKTAALGAIKAHLAAEKHIGAPADQLIRLPKDANDAAGLANMRARLGVPADEKGYDFSAVKFKDGKGLDPNFSTRVAKALIEANVSKDRAPTVAQAVVQHMEEADATEAAETAAKLAQEKQTLQANWGAKYQANMLLAQRAFEALGGKEKAGAMIEALEKIAGYDRTMDFMRGIGANMKEDGFVQSIMSVHGDGPMTRDQAAETMRQRMTDQVWTAKLSSGDTATRREFDNLTRMMQPAA